MKLHSENFLVSWKIEFTIKRKSETEELSVTGRFKHSFLSFLGGLNCDDGKLFRHFLVFHFQEDKIGFLKVYENFFLLILSKVNDKVLNKYDCEINFFLGYFSFWRKGFICI